MPSSSQPKKQKRKVMEDSSLTDADRRKLRQEQRSLQARILLEKQEMQDPSSEKFGSTRNENNKLFDNVLYTREAVLDGENLEMIACSAAQQCENLIQVPRYDAKRLCLKLKQKLSSSNGDFDWLSFGREASVCFTAIPTSTRFLLGPLDAEYEPPQKKARKKKIVVEEDEEEEEEVGVVRHGRQETTVNQLSAVERNIKVVTATLEEQTALREASLTEGASSNERRKVTQINAVEFLFNPQSFTQTVENIFHFSFLLKKGSAGIFNADGIPKVQAAGAADAHPTPRQAIVSLSMKDWRNLAAAYNVSEGMIPHRE